MNTFAKAAGVLSLTGLLLTQVGCGAVKSLVANKVSEAVGLGGSAGTVTTLWPDVPPIPGASKSNLDLPITVKLAIQAVMKASASSSDVSLDTFDFISYTTTKTPDDVAKVYTKEVMAAQGWNGKDQPGCVGTNAGSTGSGANVPIGGGFCLFAKNGAVKGQGTALIVAMVQDDSAKQTNVWYVRFAGTNLAKK